MILADLIDKKVVGLRGYPKRYGWKKQEVAFILFEDNIYLELDEQDPYSYHDCDQNARVLSLRQDAKRWKELFDAGNWLLKLDKLAHNPF